MPRGRTCLPMDPEKRAEYFATTKAKFLEVYEEKRTVKAGARAAKIDPSTLYRWRKEDQEFDKAWDLVTEIVRDARAEEYREEAHRRSVTGVLEPVVSAGKVVTKVRRYSDSLLGKLLSAHCPEFRDRLHVTAQTASSDIDLSQLSTEELRQLRALQEKARVKEPEALPQNGARHG